ncbi:hypothetical protein [Hydrogenimonas sp.]
MIALTFPGTASLSVLHVKERAFYAAKFKSKGVCAETKRFDTIEDAVQYLNEQKSISLVLPSESKVELDIALSSLITSEEMIRQLIRQKLDKEHPDIASDTFTFTPLSTDKEKKESIYRVFLIKDPYFSKITKSLKRLHILSFVTFEEYAFANYIQRSVSDNAIAVYADEKKIIVLAIAESRIVFQRTIPISTESKKDIVISEVEKTALYIQQYKREYEYSQMILAGEIAEWVESAQRLSALSMLPVSTILVPTETGFTEDERYEYIFLSGALDLTKEKNFLPPQILRAKEYHALLNILVICGAIFFFYASFLLAASALDFQESAKSYRITQKRLQGMIDRIETYPVPILLHGKEYIDTYTKVMSHHPTDDYFTLHKLIALLPPKKSEWKRTEANDVLATLLFEKDFKNLTDLYLFEKSFDQIVQDLKKKNEKLHFASATNYSTGHFSMKIDLGEKGRGNARVSRRRRRHR